MKTHCPICLQREGEPHKMDCQNAAYVRALEKDNADLRKLLVGVYSESYINSVLNGRVA